MEPLHMEVDDMATVIDMAQWAKSDDVWIRIFDTLEEVDLAKDKDECVIIEFPVKKPVKE